MLVISRKTEEFLKIGDDIVVKIIKTSNGSVKIGIEAPGGLRVLRGELVIDAADMPVPSRVRPVLNRGVVETERVSQIEAV